MDDKNEDPRVRVAYLEATTERDRAEKILIGWVALCIFCGWAVFVSAVERTRFDTDEMTCPSLNLRIVPLPGDRSRVFCAEEAGHE